MADVTAQDGGIPPDWPSVVRGFSRMQNRRWYELMGDGFGPEKAAFAVLSGGSWAPAWQTARARQRIAEVARLAQAREINRQTVADHRAAHRMPSGQWTRANTADRLAARDMYLSGKTLTEVGAHFEVTATTVWNWLRALKTPRRPQGHRGFDELGGER